MFSDRFARRSARRYGKRGLTPSAADLVGFASAQGVENATVLEISTNYETEATGLLERSGFSGRVDRRLVDIADAPDAVEPADIVILHRVVCCYPDYEKLLSAAGSHARRALGFTHPPANIIARTVIGSENLMRRIRGNPFRAFVHPPHEMIRVLQAQGLTPLLNQRRRGWQVVGLVRA